MLTSDVSWKGRLYERYLSSGQGASLPRHDDAETPERFFAPRVAHIRGVIARHLPRDRSARIIDVACGHGAFLYCLRTSGYRNISGCDISMEQVDLAHRLGVPEPECSDMLSHLRKTDSESVDTVLMMDILEHLESVELFEVLDQVFRVLKKGGSCIAHVPNAEGLYGMRIRYGDLTHERAFAPKSAQQLFRAVGFREVQCFEDLPQVHGMKSLARRAVWVTGTMGCRLLLAAETGTLGFILSQNMLVSARK